MAPLVRALRDILHQRSVASLVLLALSLLGGAAAAVAAETADRPLYISIPAGSLAEALDRLGDQSGVQIMYEPATAEGIKVAPVNGTLTVRDALTQLLAQTGLRADRVNDKTIVLKRDETQTGAKKNSDTPRSVTEVEEVTVLGKIPEVLVVGSKIINADIPRTEDDVQPYVVFDREQIGRSMAKNLNDFLKSRLPMNTVQVTNSQFFGGSNQSTVNLRGLGPAQTLILVDGRRMPSVNNSGNFAQPDINGIPMAAVERIEVLPATASGIYGGGATGGVINIIMRKDYAGAELGITYGSPFDTDASNRRVDVSGGFGLEGGRTQVLVTASHADADPLVIGDRDFVERARALQLANNPGAFFSTPTPPLGYLPNIRNASSPNSNLVLDNGTVLSSPFTHVPSGYAGPSVDGGAALVANAGRYNLELPNDFNGGQLSLLSNPTVKSVGLNLRREFSARIDAFVDASWFDNEGRTRYAGFSVPSLIRLPAAAPNNPFTTDVDVRFPAIGLSSESSFGSETIRVAGGAIVRMPRDWTALVEYAWGRSRSSFVATAPPVGDPDGAGPGKSLGTALRDGSLTVIRDLNIAPLDFSPYLLPSPNTFLGPVDTVQRVTTARFSGPLVSLPAGPITLSGLVERRDEEVLDSYFDSMSTTATTFVTFTPRRSQEVSSYYLEARLPLVRALEVQGAVRHDEYATRASPGSFSATTRAGPFPDFTYSRNRVQATKYTFGLRYAPSDDIALRASMATGFLPPSVSQIVPSVGIGSGVFIDPKRGGVPAPIGPIDQFLGGNPNLVPEESESWSAGAIFTPRILPGLRLSLDYICVEKTDEIRGLQIQDVLFLEDSLPGRVTRAPLTDPNEIALGYTGGVITAIDSSLLNIAETRLEALDVQADYTLNTDRYGTLHFYAVASWQPHLRRRTLPTSSPLEVIGFSDGPLERRGNAGVTWEQGPWTLGWSAQRYDSYRAYSSAATAPAIAETILNQGSATIPRQTYHDVFARYRFDSSSSALGGLFANVDLMLGIENVFDKSPPILVTSGVTDGYSTYGDPRLRRYSITIQKAFGAK